MLKFESKYIDAETTMVDDWIDVADRKLRVTNVEIKDPYVHITLGSHYRPEVPQSKLTFMRTDRIEISNQITG